MRDATGRVLRVDERLLQAVSVEYLRTERAEAEGGAKLMPTVTTDFGAPDLYVLACRSPKARNSEELTYADVC